MVLHGDCSSPRGAVRLRSAVLCGVSVHSFFMAQVLVAECAIVYHPFFNGHLTAIFLLFQMPFVHTFVFLACIGLRVS